MGRLDHVLTAKLRIGEDGVEIGQPLDHLEVAPQPQRAGDARPALDLRQQRVVARDVAQIVVRRVEAGRRSERQRANRFVRRSTGAHSGEQQRAEAALAAADENNLPATEIGGQLEDRGRRLLGILGKVGARLIGQHEHVSIAKIILAEDEGTRRRQRHHQVLVEAPVAEAVGDMLGEQGGDSLIV